MLGKDRSFPSARRLYRAGIFFALAVVALSGAQPVSHADAKSFGQQVWSPLLDTLAQARKLEREAEQANDKAKRKQAADLFAKAGRIAQQARNDYPKEWADGNLRPDGAPPSSEGILPDSVWPYRPRLVA